MNIVVSRSPLERLLGAARHIQTLLNDGTLTAAWGEGDPETIHQAVSAFDALEKAVALMQDDQKGASPFLRYRREILADSAAGAELRHLVFNLYGGHEHVNLRRLFESADPAQIRVALDCIASFTANGDRDTFFMSLAVEIMEAQQGAMEVAA